LHFFTFYKNASQAFLDKNQNEQDAEYNDWKDFFLEEKSRVYRKTQQLNQNSFCNL